MPLAIGVAVGGREVRSTSDAKLGGESQIVWVGNELWREDECVDRDFAWTPSVSLPRVKWSVMGSFTYRCSGHRW